MKKVCKKCKQELDIEEFIKNKSCQNGRAGTCKNCSNKYAATWKHKNSERLALIRRKQYIDKYGPIQRKKELIRRETYPLRVRAQLLKNGMRERARIGNFPFDRNILTTDYIMEWIKDTPKCPCCGIEIDYGFKDDRKLRPNSPSIDKIFPKLGYVVGNIALICWRCNNLKRDSTPDELQKIVDWMRTVMIEGKKCLT